jgi:hypothetical protein
MAAEEKDINARPARANIETVSKSVDEFAARLKRHIEGDDEWLAELSGLPEIACADDGGGTGDASHLEATATLFAVWWRAQRK